MIYVGDGVWKSGAEQALTSIAEHYGAAVATTNGDARGVPVTHPLHCLRINEAVQAVNPDQLICVGVRHGGAGAASDFAPFASVERIIAVGSGVANFQNLPGLELEILADELRTLERLEEVAHRGAPASKYDDRRQRGPHQPDPTRPLG